MTRTILVGTDCSDCGNRAIDYAAERAKATDSRLIVAYVIEWSPYTFNTPTENEQRHKRREEEIDRAHREIIDPLVQRLRAEGVNAEGVIRHGHIAESLSEIAQDFDAEAIFIGRKGTSRFKKMLFGSVAATLVQVADRPVTVVP